MCFASHKSTTDGALLDLVVSALKLFHFCRWFGSHFCRWFGWFMASLRCPANNMLFLDLEQFSTDNCKQLIYNEHRCISIEIANKSYIQQKEISNICRLTLKVLSAPFWHTVFALLTLPPPECKPVPKPTSALTNEVMAIHGERIEYSEYSARR